MEFWPKKKSPVRHEPLVLKSVFNPPGFTEEEIAQYPRNLDGIDSPESFIEAVDFDTLNEVFDSLSRKSEGASEVHTLGHRVTRDIITFTESNTEEVQSNLGSARIKEGTITLNWKKTDEGKSKSYQTIRMLQTLAHEAAHIRAGYFMKDWERGTIENLDYESGFTLNSGLSQTDYSTRTELKKGGLSLDEAVTEDIANEVLAEYLKRTGSAGYLKDPYLRKELGGGAYIVDRLILGVVIDGLAQSIGVHRDEIWKGFVQAYMSGSTELWSLLADISAQLENQPEIAELVSSLGSNVSMDKKDELSISQIMDRFNDPFYRWAILKRIEVLDAEKLKNVLGFH